MEVTMDNNSKDCFDTLDSLQSLEALLEETFRICEKVLSHTVDSPVSPVEETWNEEIEAENHFFSQKIDKLEQKFQNNNRIFNDCFIVKKD
jgi:hypothetical protein